MKHTSNRSSVGRLLLLLRVGCVSTSDLPASPREVCAQPSTEEEDEGAVFQLLARVNEGTVQCSAVAIASTLLVTSLACVFRVNLIGDPDPSSGPWSYDYFAGVDFFGVCDPKRAWAPVEDGSFASTLGEPIDATSMVVRTLGSDRDFAVKEVFTSMGSSRCTPGVALLRVDGDLGTPGAPIRLTETTNVGEAIRVEGYCPDPNSVKLRGQDSNVQALGTSAIEATVPPNTLLALHGISGNECGGGVFSADTGALIGVAASGNVITCGEADPAVQTVVVRLAPFRELLLQTANSKGMKLREEALTDAGATCNRR